MPLSNALSSAVSGLASSSKRVQTSANNIVNANTPEFTAQQVTTSSLATPSDISGGGGVKTQILATQNPVNLVREFSQLIEAEAAYKSSVRTIQAAEKLSRDTVDILT